MSRHVQFVYDQDDILTFVQTTGGATVEAFDSSVDAVTTTGASSNVLDLGVVSPNHLGQSLYIRPLLDVNGVGIGGTGTPKMIATLYHGATATPATAAGSANQASKEEVLEITLPQDVTRYVKIIVKSNGGGASNSITTGAFQVYFGPSNQKD